MIRLELSENEARLLALLLERAGDEFANHGCNDFNVSAELGMGKAEAKKIVATELLPAMVASGAASEDQLEDASHYLYDWQLLRHFEKKVRGALG